MRIFLKELGLESYKIASGDLTNFPLVEKVANFQKPMIISTGASDFWEVEKTLNFAKNINPKNYTASMYINLSSKTNNY